MSALASPSPSVAGGSTHTRVPSVLVTCVVLAASATATTVTASTLLTAWRRWRQAGQLAHDETLQATLSAFSDNVVNVLEQLHDGPFRFGSAPGVGAARGTVVTVEQSEFQFLLQQGGSSSGNGGGSGGALSGNGGPDGGMGNTSDSNSATSSLASSSEMSDSLTSGSVSASYDLRGMVGGTGGGGGGGFYGGGASPGTNLNDADNSVTDLDGMRWARQSGTSSTPVPYGTGRDVMISSHPMTSVSPLCAAGEYTMPNVLVTPPALSSSFSVAAGTAASAAVGGTQMMRQTSIGVRGAMASPPPSLTTSAATGVAAGDGRTSPTRVENTRGRHRSAGWWRWCGRWRSSSARLSASGRAIRAVMNVLFCFPFSVLTSTARRLLYRMARVLPPLRRFTVAQTSSLNEPREDTTTGAGGGCERGKRTTAAGAAPTTTAASKTGFIDGASAPEKETAAAAGNTATSTGMDVPITPGLSASIEAAVSSLRGSAGRVPTVVVVRAPLDHDMDLDANALWAALQGDPCVSEDGLVDVVLMEELRVTPQTVAAAAAAAAAMGASSPSYPAANAPGVLEFGLPISPSSRFSMSYGGCGGGVRGQPPGASATAMRSASPTTTTTLATTTWYDVPPAMHLVTQPPSFSSPRGDVTEGDGVTVSASRSAQPGLTFPHAYGGGPPIDDDWEGLPPSQQSLSKSQQEANGNAGARAVAGGEAERSRTPLLRPLRPDLSIPPAKSTTRSQQPPMLSAAAAAQNSASAAVDGGASGAAAAAASTVSPAPHTSKPLQLSFEVYPAAVFYSYIYRAVVLQQKDTAAAEFLDRLVQQQQQQAQHLHHHGGYHSHSFSSPSMNAAASAGFLDDLGSGTIGGGGPHLPTGSRTGSPSLGATLYAGGAAGGQTSGYDYGGGASPMSPTASVKFLFQQVSDTFGGFPVPAVSLRSPTAGASSPKRSPHVWEKTFTFHVKGAAAAAAAAMATTATNVNSPAAAIHGSVSALNMSTMSTSSPLRGLGSPSSRAELNADPTTAAATSTSAGAGAAALTSPLLRMAQSIRSVVTSPSSAFTRGFADAMRSPLLGSAQPAPSGTSSTAATGGKSGSGASWSSAPEVQVRYRVRMFRQGSASREALAALEDISTQLRSRWDAFLSARCDLRKWVFPARHGTGGGGGGGVGSVAANTATSPFARASATFSSSGALDHPVGTPPTPTSLSVYGGPDTYQIVRLQAYVVQAHQRRESMRETLLKELKDHGFRICAIPLPDMRVYRLLPPGVPRYVAAHARGFTLCRTYAEELVAQQRALQHVLLAAEHRQKLAEERRRRRREARLRRKRSHNSVSGRVREATKQFLRVFQRAGMGSSPTGSHINSENDEGSPTSQGWTAAAAAAAAGGRGTTVTDSEPSPAVRTYSYRSETPSGTTTTTTTTAAAGPAAGKAGNTSHSYVSSAQSSLRASVDRSGRPITSAKSPPPPPQLLPVPSSSSSSVRASAATTRDVPVVGAGQDVNSLPLFELTLAPETPPQPSLAMECAGRVEERRGKGALVTPTTAAASENTSAGPYVVGVSDGRKPSPQPPSNKPALQSATGACDARFPAPTGVQQGDTVLIPVAAHTSSSAGAGGGSAARKQGWTATHTGTNTYMGGTGTVRLASPAPLMASPLSPEGVHTSGTSFSAAPPQQPMMLQPPQVWASSPSPHSPVNSAATTSVSAKPVPMMMMITDNANTKGQTCAHQRNETVNDEADVVEELTSLAPSQVKQVVQLRQLRSPRPDSEERAWFSVRSDSPGVQVHTNAANASELHAHTEAALLPYTWSADSVNSFYGTTHYPLYHRFFSTGYANAMRVPAALLSRINTLGYGDDGMAELAAAAAAAAASAGGPPLPNLCDDDAPGGAFTKGMGSQQPRGMNVVPPALLDILGVNAGGPMANGVDYFYNFADATACLFNSSMVPKPDGDDGWDMSTTACTTSMMWSSGGGDGPMLAAATAATTGRGGHLSTTATSPSTGNGWQAEGGSVFAPTPMSRYEATDRAPTPPFATGGGGVGNSGARTAPVSSRVSECGGGNTNNNNAMNPSVATANGMGLAQDSGLGLGVDDDMDPEERAAYEQTVERHQRNALFHSIFRHLHEVFFTTVLRVPPGVASSSALSPPSPLAPGSGLSDSGFTLPAIAGGAIRTPTPATTATFPAVSTSPSTSIVTATSVSSPPPPLASGGWNGGGSELAANAGTATTTSAFASMNEKARSGLSEVAASSSEVAGAPTNRRRSFFATLAMGDVRGVGEQKVNGGVPTKSSTARSGATTTQSAAAVGMSSASSAATITATLSSVLQRTDGSSSFSNGLASVLSIGGSDAIKTNASAIGAVATTNGGGRAEDGGDDPSLAAAGNGATLPPRAVEEEPDADTVVFGHLCRDRATLNVHDGQYGISPFEVFLATRYSRRIAAEVYAMDVAASKGDPFYPVSRVLDEVVTHAVLYYHHRSLADFVEELERAFDLRYVPKTRWGVWLLRSQQRQHDESEQQQQEQDEDCAPYPMSANVSTSTAPPHALPGAGRPGQSGSASHYCSAPHHRHHHNARSKDAMGQSQTSGPAPVSQPFRSHFTAAPHPAPSSSSAPPSKRGQSASNTTTTTTAAVVDDSVGKEGEGRDAHAGYHELHTHQSQEASRDPLYFADVSSDNDDNGTRPTDSVAATALPAHASWSSAHVAVGTTADGEANGENDDGNEEDGAANNGNVSSDDETHTFALRGKWLEPDDEEEREGFMVFTSSVDEEEDEHVFYGAMEVGSAGSAAFNGYLGAVFTSPRPCDHTVEGGAYAAATSTPAHPLPTGAGANGQSPAAHANPVAAAASAAANTLLLMSERDHFEDCMLLRELEHVKEFILEHRHVFSSAMLTPAGSNRLEGVFGVPATVFPFLLCARESVAFVHTIFESLEHHYGTLVFDNFAKYAHDVFYRDRPEIIRHAPRIFRTLNKSRRGHITYEELCGWMARKLSCGNNHYPNAHLLATCMSLRLPMALLLDQKSQWPGLECTLNSLSDGDVDY